MKFFNTTKYRISMLVVMVMLLQVLMPAVGDVVWAEGDEPAFRITKEEIKEDKTATIEWTFKLDPNNRMESETYELGFTLDKAVENEKLVANDEDKTEIGTYSISKGGELTVTIDLSNDGETEEPNPSEDTAKDLYEELQEVDETKDLEKQETNEEVELEETTGDENEDVDEKEQDIDADNEKTEDESQKDDENNDEIEEPKIYRGTIIVNGVTVDETEEEKHGFVLELFKVTDLNDNPYTEDNLLDPKDEFKLKLEWNLVNGHSYKKGDTVTFDLPKGIKIQENIEAELKDASGQIVANAVVTTDNKVELTFTGFVETHSNVKGYMEIISEIDEKDAEIGDGKIILKPIGEEGEIRIPIDLGDREKTIEKRGETNKSYNADEINWEVIINKHKINLTNAQVVDELPAGTEYKEGSLEVTKLKADLNGNILGDLEKVTITPIVNKIGEEGKLKDQLTIPLGDIKDAYRIEYVTTVTDEEKKTFKNNVTLTENGLDGISANATVTINRGEPIKKSAGIYDPKTGIIEWRIEFNFNQKDLKDVTLIDKWTPKEKMELVEASLKFQEVTIDENGNPHNNGGAIYLPDGATLAKGEDQFEVTGITTGKAYIVTYQTKVKDRVLDPFEIKNTAGFGGESSSSGKKVGIYYGSKSAGTVDYKNKTIDWRIAINYDQYPMEKISVKDTLGEGLTLDKESINITVDGQKYEGNYTVSDGNPFTINFPEDFKTNKEIIITYKTKFVADEVPLNEDKKPIARNKAEITWTPEDGSESITKEVKAETPLNKGTEDNSWKYGSYNPDAKEITWTILVNYRENEISNLIIEDEPQENQKIVEGSAVVTELNIANDGKITEGNTVENVATIDKNTNTLKVNIGNTNKAHKIEYRTSIAGLSDIQKEYINKATVHDGDKKLCDLSAKVGIAKAHTYGAKSGKQDGKQVHWSVTVNPGQQKVINLKLEDTVSENQEILTDTFKVYEASVDIKGNATKGNELSSNKYELKHTEGERVFTVEWKDTVERVFIVEYSTLFFEKHGGEVTNIYKITGDNIVEGGKTYGDGKVTITQLASGGGSGEVGYLVIDKVDTTNGGSEKLEGAEFDLIDADTNKVLKSGVTDEKGQIDFGRLLYGKYKLKETKVPAGYVTLNEEQEIEINKPYKSGDDKVNFKYTVENYKPVFAIELSKTGKDNKALEGAEFTLYDSDHNELKTATTGKDGKILFEDLKKSGTYYVQETKAPEGYELKDTKHEVTIGEKEKEPVKITIENNVLVGKTSASGEKTWKDENSTDRPESIELKLTRKVEEKIDADFSKLETVKPNSEGKWVYEFKDLDKYDENGLEYEYMVKEINVPKNYKSIVDGHNITNIRIGKTEVSGNKTWKDDTESDRPNSITVNLLRNGTVIKTKEVTAEDGWKYSFTGLDKYDGKGKLYTYTVTEQDVPGYASQVDGNNIINTRSEKKSIEITKGWLDDNSKARPDSVTVYLYQNDKLFDTVEIKVGSDWKYKFDDLETYDENGKSYSYKVKEEPVDGYETAVDGFNITNLRVGKTEVTGTKTWVGGPNTKPTIELQLYKNGEKLESLVELKDGVTTYTWTELDKFDENGVEYEYTIDEVKVPNNYRKSISEDGLTITNTYRPPTDPYEPGEPEPEEPKPEEPEEPKPEEPKPEEPEPEKPEPEEPEPEEPEPEEPIPEEPIPEKPTVIDPPEHGTVEFDEDEKWIYIPDPNAPKGKITFTIKHPDGREETIEIDLDKIPKGTTQITEKDIKLPKTGQINNIFFYFTGLVLIILGFVFIKRIA